MNDMDIRQVIQARSNRGTRLARPFDNFHDMYKQCVAAGELIISGAIDPAAHVLIERSVVVSLVTSIEVYYRDVMAFIFKYCTPTFFEPHLRYLLPDKFDITELIAFYRHRVHPLELVVSAQSFQNADRIDRIFSKFLPTAGLWASVLEMKVRIKDRPDTESSFSADFLVALKNVFALRHELVHDPARRSFFDESILSNLHGAAGMVFGSDLVLSRVIQENRDPELDCESGA